MDYDGRSALHLAATRSHLLIVRVRSTKLRRTAKPFVLGST